MTSHSNAVTAVARTTGSDCVPTRARVRQWAAHAQPFAQPQTPRSVLQLMTTALPLVGLWATMITTIDVGYWLTLGLSVPAAAFTVRLFIIQHDCGHRSFFRSARLNDWLGTLIGVVTLTPHSYWRRAHNIHHATCGNLEHRGIGDISVLTTAEYENLPRWKRLAYRVYRNPLILLGLGPTYLFVIKYRLPLDLVRRHPRLLVGVMGTNLAICGAVMGLGLGFGFTNVLMVHIPIVVLSSAAGVWLFYVQHQFERTWWKVGKNWDFHEASVLASSYYRLPPVLRWFSGNIGIHHLHHLSCRIPNYRLAACLGEISDLQALNRIEFWNSLNCFRLALWDETAERLIPFRTYRRMKRRRQLESRRTPA